MLDISPLSSRVGEWGTKVLISLHYMSSRIGAGRGVAFPIPLGTTKRLGPGTTLAWLGLEHNEISGKVDWHDSK